MIHAHDWHDTAQSAFRSSQRVYAQYSRRLRRAEGWTFALYLALGVVLLSVLLPGLIALATIGVVALLVVLWVREFVTLMSCADADFPGRHDKLVWSVLMLVLAPIGPVAFWWYRRCHGLPPHPWAAKPPWSVEDRDWR